MKSTPCVSRAVGKQPPFHCDIRVSFATAFSNWRRKNKVPLKTIAKVLGVSVSTVSSWELGERFPTGYNFELLVDYTGLPPCKLFCVMADKCVPADCLLAMSQLKPARSTRQRAHPPRAR
jgi:transcriptional regulator with XRE-family HTH domain